ncbi:MAG: DUF4123 domain-containing protein [Rhodobacteraceae bacterium]|nr:MAG: DUF4123 domain-containing protein [Paracoccaceae bacterium]
MDGVYTLWKASHFHFRKVLRRGRVYLVVDPDSFPELGDALEESDLPYTNLYGKGEGVLGQTEAPYIVQLNARDIANWKHLIKNLRNQNVAIGLIAPETVDIHQLRRHWKKWISVRIPNEDQPVMFRFFDPRILFAFLATLSAAEAHSFYGPAQHLIGFQDGQLEVATPEAVVRNTAPLKLGVGEHYLFRAEQVQAMEDVTSQVFKDRLKRYLRIVWWQYAEDMPEEQLSQIVEDGIADAKKLESMTDNSVLAMTLIRLIDPSVSTNSKYWRHAYDGAGKEHPGARAIFLLSVMFDENFPHDRETVELLFYKANRFGRPEEQWHDIPRNWETK